MSRVMYWDCSSGAAGDMILAALLDAGLPLDALTGALGSLGVEHRLVVRRVMRAGIAASHVSVEASADKNGHGAGRHGAHRGGDSHEHGHSHTHGHPHAHGHSHADGHSHDHGHRPGADEPGRVHSHSHRGLVEIGRLIDGSALSPAGKARAQALFRRIGEAEAAIHGIPVDRVHLHEVGAVDSIIDIVGAVFAFEWFGIDDIVASPLNVGGGTVEIAHGTFPVPAPATLQLLTGVPVYSSGIPAELVTPTGALLMSAYARSYGPMPAMRPARIGYGAGTRDLGTVPNVLRVVIGDRSDAVVPGPGSVVEIVCEIDDMNPQLFGPVMERALAAGALDVFLTPIQMKKGRPGTLLTALAPEPLRVAVTDLLFRETTTLGVRFTAVSRETLDRTWDDVALPGGSIRVKVAGRAGQILNAAPEFEDCLRVAAATGQPVKAVQAAAMRAWLERHSP